MAITIASWNVNGSLGNPRKLSAVANQVNALNADVVIMPEAFRGNIDTVITEAVTGTFYALGYHRLKISRYSTSDRDKARAHLMMGRMAMSHPRPVPEARGRALVSHLYDQETGSAIRMFGVDFSSATEPAKLSILRKITHLTKADQPFLILGNLATQPAHQLEHPPRPSQDRLGDMIWEQLHDNGYTAAVPPNAQPTNLLSHLAHTSRFDEITAAAHPTRLTRTDILVATVQAPCDYPC